MRLTSVLEVSRLAAAPVSTLLAIDSSSVSDRRRPRVPSSSPVTAPGSAAHFQSE
jgi:hypothetical protein